MAQMGSGFMEVGAGATKTIVTIPAGLTPNDTSTGASILGGYMYNKNVGAEVGYVDLGKPNVSATANVNTTLYGQPLIFNGTATVEGKATGFLAGVRLSMPLNDKLSFGARVGLMSWTTDVTASANAALTYGTTTTAANVSQKRTFTGTDAYYGLRASYSMTDNVSLSLGYTMYKLVNDLDAKVNATDLYLTYRF